MPPTEKKCDLGYPVCRECLRLNYVCQRETPRSPPSTGASEPKSVQQPTSKGRDEGMYLLREPDPAHFWIDEHDTNFSSPDSRRLILRYYTQTFTLLLTTNLENNSFLSVFLPMAIYDMLLLDALVAWASGHLSLQSPPYRQLAMQNRGYALRNLIRSLGSHAGSPETKIATCLVFCSMESIMSDQTGEWYTHLLGASEIIRTLQNSSEDHPEGALSKFGDKYAGKWLLQNFAYHDILMAVSLDRLPLLCSEQFLTRCDSTTPDSYFGLASEILVLIADTAALNSELKAELQKDTEPSIPSLSSADALNLALTLERKLKDWECGPCPDKALILLADSYRSSALIYLYRTIRRHIPQLTANISSKIADQVDKIVKNVRQMPDRCLPECTLLFPLFLAGGEAIEDHHIQTIKGKMLDMIKSRTFKNVEVALSVLEELWRLRLERRGLAFVEYLDWQDVIQRRNLSLSLS